MRLQQSDSAKSNGYLGPGCPRGLLPVFCPGNKSIFDSQEVSLHCGSERKHKEVISY